MPTFRLDSVQPRLAEAFRRASPLRQREATRLACEGAASAAELSGPEVDAALETLRTGGPARADLRADLEALAARLDEEYFRLDQDGTEVDQPAALRVFSKARATSALAFCLAPNPGDLHEAIYEAIAALEDPRELVQAAEAALL